jgi:hypothetical protein
MILDSPFTSLSVLAEELAKNYANVPKLLVSTAMKLIRKSIKSKAHFDIKDLNPIEHVGQCFIPALFAAGKEDTFIVPAHAQALHEKYAGDKNLVLVDGDHNSPRPQYFLDSVGIFFYNTLMCAMLPEFKPVQRTEAAEGAAETSVLPPEFHFGRAMEFQSELFGQDVTEEDLIAQAIAESLRDSEESKQVDANPSSTH